MIVDDIDIDFLSLTHNNIFFVQYYIYKIFVIFSFCYQLCIYISRDASWHCLPILINIAIICGK